MVCRSRDKALRRLRNIRDRSRISLDFLSRFWPNFYRKISSSIEFPGFDLNTASFDRFFIVSIAFLPPRYFSIIDRTITNPLAWPLRDDVIRMCEGSTFWRSRRHFESACVKSLHEAASPP